MRSAIVVLLVALVVGVAVPDASARRIEDWPYDKLFKESDLVVIATATGSKDNGEKTNLGWKTEFLGVDTTFKVHGTLKGKAPVKLTVLHFRAPEGEQFADGPLLVTFRDKPVEIEIKRPKALKASVPPPEYILFLKAPKGAKETRYEPVSGRVDPELSVKDIFPGGTDRRIIDDEK